MQFKILNHTSKSFSIIELTSPNEDGTENSIVFDVSGYSSTTPGAVRKGSDGIDKVVLFPEVNSFMAENLNIEEQNKLFIIYERIDNLFNDDYDFRKQGGGGGMRFDKQLSKLCCEIYDIIDFNKLLAYVKTKVADGTLRIPADIHPEHRTEDRLTPRYVDCTYLTPDYHELIAMCLGLRFMIPVWGRYMPLLRQADQSSMKEYRSYQLIMGSKFHRASCFSRLERYVCGNMDVRDDLGVILAGLSSEEIPIFLMAISTVRKLAVASLSAEDDRKHLIRMLYHYVKNKAINLSKSLGHTVRGKLPQSEDRDIEDNSSVLDIYKMREEVPVGDLAVIETYLLKYADEGLSIYGSDVKPALVQQCQNNLLRTKNFSPSEAQLRLVTWIVSVLVPGNTVPLFGKDTVNGTDVLKKTFAITQAVLWSWGMYELAILVTARIVPLEQDERFAKSFRKQLSEDRVATFNEIYPHEYDTDDRDEFGHITNVGVRSVERLSSFIYRNDWEVNCPKNLAKKFENSDIVSVFEASPDMRNQLADVLIKLSEVF